MTIPANPSLGPSSAQWQRIASELDVVRRALPSTPALFAAAFAAHGSPLPSDEDWPDNTRAVDATPHGITWWTCAGTPRVWLRPNPDPVPGQEQGDPMAHMARMLWSEAAPASILAQRQPWAAWRGAWSLGLYVLHRRLPITGTLLLSPEDQKAFRSTWEQAAAMLSEDAAVVPTPGRVRARPPRRAP